MERESERARERDREGEFQWNCPIIGVVLPLPHIIVYHIQAQSLHRLPLLRNVGHCAP